MEDYDYDDFWQDWNDADYHLDEVIIGDDSGSDGNWWDDGYGYGGDYGDDYGYDYGGGGGGGYDADAYSAPIYDGPAFDIDLNDQTAVKNALAASGLAAGVQSFNHTTLSNLANILGGEAEAVQLLSKSGLKIGIIGAVIGSTHVAVTIADNGGIEGLTGEEKEDIAITALSVAGVVAGGIGTVAAANFWNPVGWVLGGIAVGWAIYDHVQDSNGNTDDVFVGDYYKPDPRY